MRKNPVLPFCSLVVLASFGCSGERSESFEPQTLIRVTAAGADEMCARGGVVIESGVDENRNGVLDDEEVSSSETQVICEGETNPPDGGVAPGQHAVLTRTTTVAVGSEECRYGGQRIEAGIDDGAGAGEPDDDVLADDEVDTSYLDCNPTPPTPVDVIAPPAGEPGTAVIELRGGSAATGARGGYGGTFAAENRDAEQCIPEVTRVFPTGTVDASFAAPEVTIDLGPVPMVVSATGTLKDAADTLVDGDFYYDGAIGAVRRYMGGAGPIVTGMRVASNVTFVLPNASSITFANDVEILGTVKNSAAEVRSLSLSADKIIVAPSGRIEVLQQLTGGGLTLQSQELLWLRGKLSVQGETNGAPGGFVGIYAGGRIILEGSIDAYGADSSTNGGAGGTVQAFPSAGGLWNAASIDASGGEGALVGGAGGGIFLGAQLFGRNPNASLGVRNAGPLAARGGAQTACSDASCNGGSGGTIDLVALGAELRSTGALDADGGDSQISGGSGGTVRFAILPGRDGIRPPELGIAVSGGVSARGGDGTTAGGTAGQGGSLFFSNCGGNGSSADFLGYASVQLGGGAADPTGGATGLATAGGGGVFRVLANQPSERSRRLYVHVPFAARGGDGYTAGEGGFVEIDLSTEVQTSALPSGIPSLVFAGAHVFDGGTSGQSGGGRGGTVSLRALGSVVMEGSISASSISTESDGDVGSGQIELVSLLGAVTVDADLHADGADGALYNGSSGGCISLDGRTLSFTGSATALGGDAHEGSGNTGGDGGRVVYVSHDAAADVDATVRVSGGAGTPAGASGSAGADLPSCFEFRLHNPSST